MTVIDKPVTQTPAVSGSNLVRFRRDPIGFLRQLASESGPLAPFQIGKHTLVLLNDPALIEQVLVTEQGRFVKGSGLLRSSALLGNGLLTSDGDAHRANRRRLQPAFHRREMAAYADTMIAKTLEWKSVWHDGETRDIHRDMMRLTLNIVAATLFNSDVEPDASEVADAMAEALSVLYGKLGPDGCPHAVNATSSVNQLEESLSNVIASRTIATKENDFLSLLTSDEIRELTPQQIRDEAMTFFLAGHESVANALTWTWYVLSQHSDIALLIQEELAWVIGDRTPTSDDLEKLVYTRQVLSESMRLYPPAWMISRQASEAVQIGGQEWKTGTIFIAAQCVTHVDTRYFPDPMRFDPDRWAGDAVHDLPRFAYFPFGGGSRICIGERFAWTELLAVLAVLVPRWRLTMPPKSFTPRWDPLVTLRPRDGLFMRVERIDTPQPQ